jgi:6-hydroxytryprostatin B O-methyltransferase
MPHDFFKPQPIQAGAYVLRQILHDWPDAEAVEILQNLIPSLTKGARVILVETILPPVGVLPQPLERFIRRVFISRIKYFPLIDY